MQYSNQIVMFLSGTYLFSLSFTDLNINIKVINMQKQEYVASEGIIGCNRVYILCYAVINVNHPYLMSPSHHCPKRHLELTFSSAEHLRPLN